MNFVFFIIHQILVNIYFNRLWNLHWSSRYPIVSTIYEYSHQHANNSLRFVWSNPWLFLPLFASRSVVNSTGYSIFVVVSWCVMIGGCSKKRTLWTAEAALTTWGCRPSPTRVSCTPPSVWFLSADWTTSRHSEWVPSFHWNR